MDYIVTHGRIKEKLARKFFRQVVSAIDYCHSMGVIHRDIKAENLLLDHRLRVKLIDFGLSNQWVPGELLKTFCGSPTYTAPELIKRQEYEGPEVDVWALGVLLYALVCGSLPFDGNSFQELFTKIIHGDYIVPEFVSPECRDLIWSMLVVDPMKRASLDQIREHPWIKQSGEPIPKSVPNFYQTHLSEDDFNEEILDLAVSYGFKREDIIRSVLNNCYDHCASIYFLLLDRNQKIREEEAIRRNEEMRKRRQQQLSSQQSKKKESKYHSKSLRTGGNQNNIPIENNHQAIINDHQPNNSKKNVKKNSQSSFRKHRRHHTLGSTKDFEKDIMSDDEYNDDILISKNDKNMRRRSSRMKVLNQGNNNGNTVNHKRLSRKKKDISSNYDKDLIQLEESLSPPPFTRNESKKKSDIKSASLRPKKNKETFDSPSSSSKTRHHRRYKSVDLDGSDHENIVLIQQSVSPNKHHKKRKSDKPKKSSRESSKSNVLSKNIDIIMEEDNEKKDNLTSNNNNNIIKNDDYLDHNDYNIIDNDLISPSKNGRKSIFTSLKRKMLGNKKSSVSRFSFNENTTSHKSPELIMEHLKKVLNNMKIDNVLKSESIIKCETSKNVFEAEITRVPNLSLNGIKFRRISGDAWEYSKTVSKVLKKLDLKKFNSKPK